MQAGSRVELLKDVLDVLVHRSWADREPPSDLRVREPLGQASQYLPFAIRELTETLCQIPFVLTRPRGGFDGGQESFRVDEPSAGSRCVHRSEYFLDPRRPVDDAERSSLDPCDKEVIGDELVGDKDDR